jgi:flagellar L-ring protein precursor FlgH
VQRAEGGVNAASILEEEPGLDPQKQLFRYILLASLIFGPASSEAQQVMKPAPGSLFTDVRGHAVGDLVTILIMEESSAASSARTVTDKEHELGIEGEGTGGLGAIPGFGLNGTSRNKFNGAATTARQGALRAKMTGMIVEVKENGNLVIEGTRSVKINNETETTILRGEVRRKDVTPDNTVYSYDLANVQITHLGKGAVNSGHRPGLLVRLFNLLF